MLITYLLFLTAGSVATLVAGLKWRRWILTGISSGLGFVWGTLGKTIEFNTGAVIMRMKTPELALLGWLVTAIGISFTMFGVMSYFKDRNKSVVPGGYAS